MHLQSLVHHIVEDIDHGLLVELAGHLVEEEVEALETLGVFCIEGVGAVAILLERARQLFVQSA